MGLEATVAVIWRPRTNMTAVFDAAQAWWSEHGIQTELVDSPADRWNAAAARNEAMRRFGRPGQPLVIADADTHPQDLRSLEMAIARSWDQPDVVHLPYTEYQVRDLGDPSPIASFDWSVSGILVSTPGPWWAIGGQDERFIEWAPEDFAFHMAHETILGLPMPRTRGTVIAYAHSSNPGRQMGRDPHPLYEEYKAADDNIQAMRALVDGASAGP